MKKIMVPMDKCPLEVLAGMGEETKNAWIFFHDNVIKRLRKTADKVVTVSHIQELLWRGEDNKKMFVDFEKGLTDWRRVYRINSINIAFRNEPRNPENVIFLQMEA